MLQVYFRRGRIRNAIRNAPTGAGATTKRFANAPKDTWGNIAKPLFVIRYAWTEGTARLPESAAALRDTKEDTAKEVSQSFKSEIQYSML